MIFLYDFFIYIVFINYMYHFFYISISICGLTANIMHITEVTDIASNRLITISFACVLTI